MAWYVLRRLSWMVLTLWIIFTVSFVLISIVPGGPFDSERQMEPEVRANIERKYHLDEPLPMRYLRTLDLTLHGDLGISSRLRDFTVNEVIAQGLPISGALGALALAGAIIVGLAAGIVSAVRRGTPLDFAMMTIATVGIALPNFVIAGVMLLLFVFTIPLFPAAGWGSVRQLVLPAFCLGAPYAAYIARLVRAGMLDVLGQDYIRTAVAKGLPGRTVIFRHALRGALLPLVSFLGPATAGILTGSLVVEQVFAIPGLGVHFVRAATQRDETMAMGMVLLYSTLLYLMNLLVDLAYALLDPRVKLE